MIIKLSFVKCVLYFFINILHVVFFTVLAVLLLHIGLEDENNSIFILILLSILCLILAVYPLVFFIYFLKNDKSISIYIKENSDTIIYKLSNKNHVVFKINDINKINVCFPLIRLTINYYYKIYLNSGQVLIVTCLTPIKQLRKRANIKKEKLEHKFWIDDFMKH
jgi:hypothetical protein